MAKESNTESKKVIVITGTSRGLGASFLNQLQSKNHTIICIQRNTKDVAALNNDHHYIELDLSRPRDDWDVDAYLPESFDELVFINNAGTFGAISKVSDLSASDIETAQSVNISMPIIIIKKLLDLSLRCKRPYTIINISSGAANHPFAGWSLYCASKSYMKMFLDCLDLEYEHLSVTHIDPGVMDTGMQAEIREAPSQHFPEKEQFVDLKKNNDLRSTDDVAMDILRTENLI